MASKGAPKGAPIDELTAKFAAFCTKDMQFNSKDSNDFVKECLVPHCKSKSLGNRIDSSVFSRCKEKGKPHMAVNNDNCKLYLKRAAFECAKINHGDATKEDDSRVAELEANITKTVKASTGKTFKATKISKTGGVDRMTDTSQYTGAHKERFTADGKGKGIEGRDTRHENTGYTGQYKGKGTFDNQ